LKELPSSIGQLNALQEFDLSGCSSLKELPSSIGQLNALQKLDLSGCSSLKELPSSIGQLNAVQEFILCECLNLKELPSSIGQLNALKKFDLSGCFDLKELPSSIGQLNALQELDLSGCPSLKELPSSIGQLNALQEFDLSGCSSLKELPSSIGQLNVLQEFILCECCNLKELFSSIGQLNALKKFDLSGCSNLKELPSSIGRLNALKKFDLSRCFNLKELPSSIGQLNALQEFILCECCNLKELPSSIGQLNALQELDLSGCSSLKELPSYIGQLNALQKLDLSGCSSLKELPSSVGELNAIQEFILCECFNLKKLPSSIGQLNVLKKFDLSGCFELKELPSSIGQLNALKELYLIGCSSLQELPTFIGQLNALQKFDLTGCSNLQKLPTSIGQLNALQKFNLCDCSQLQELPTSIGRLSALQDFNLKGCFKLMELPTSISELNALRKFNLGDCSQLQELPTSIGQLNALQDFNLEGCSKLMELPTSIGQLSALQDFNLKGCSKLMELPIFIGELNALQKFNLANYSQFEELPITIGQLSAFQDLNLEGCSTSMELPTSIGQLNALQCVEEVDAIQNSSLEEGFELEESPISINKSNAFGQHLILGETSQSLKSNLSNDIMRWFEVHKKFITSTPQLLNAQNGGNAFKIVASTKNNDGGTFDFFFASAKCMTKVVGVGLEWAKVEVCMKSFDVKVISIGENAWRNPWEQVEQTGCSKDFILLNCNLANMNRNKFNISKLTAKESSKKFGIGVHVQGTLKHGEVNTYVEDKGKYVAFSPLIWDLVQYMINSYCKQCVGSTSNVSGSNASHNQEGSKGKEKVNMNSQFPPESSNKRDENEEDDKHGPPLSNIGSNVEINAKKEKILKVTVFPRDGGDFYQGNPCHAVEPIDEINTATINTTLVFQFELGNTRKLTITTETGCSLGNSVPERYDGNYLGYYQDNIKISLSCVEANGAQISSPGPIVERTEKIKFVKSIQSTHTKSDAKNTIAQGNVQLQTNVLPVNFQFNGQGGQNWTTTTGDSNSYTTSVEVYNEQVDEFLIQRRGTTKSSYDCKFEFAHNVLDYAKQDDFECRKQFVNQSRIFDTFWPKIESKWNNLNNSEECPYMFETKRDLIAIQDHYQSNKNNTKFRPLEQRYVVDMFVNHAMTHMTHMITDYDEIELSQGMENSNSGLKVNIPTQERWRAVIIQMQEKWQDLRLRVSSDIGN
jgi:Leucine-rich repeat (LRR) protein